MTDERSDFVPDPDLLSAAAVGETTLSRDTPTSADDSFPAEVDNEIEGLLYLGALSTVADVWGHKFEIHTLRAGEELARDQIISEYDGMLGQAKALGLATAAASVKAIDGSPLQRPLSPNKSEIISAIRANFNTFSSYYFPVIERLYEEYEKLEVRQARAFRRLEGK